MRRWFRFLRTSFVHRWHAAQTIGELFDNPWIGYRFEHINHVRSLVQYIWRFGAFRERDDGTGRCRAASDLPGLGAMIRPIARRGRKHFEHAVLYAARFGDAAPPRAETDPELRQLIDYAARHRDIRTFARQLTALHRAMLDYHVQMCALTRQRAIRLRTAPFPIFSGLSGLGGPCHAAEQRGKLPRSDALPADLGAALLATFARDIYRALCSRARTELFATLHGNHPHACTIAEARPAASAATTGPGLRTPSPGRRDRPARATIRGVLIDGQRIHFVVYDRSLATMLKSLTEAPMPRIVRWLAAFKNFVSAVITALPVFIVKNFFRDTLAGFVAGRYWQMPFLGTLRGTLIAIGDLGRERRDLKGCRTVANPDPMHDYLLQGGFYSGLVESETHLAPVRHEDGHIRKAATLARLRNGVVHWVTRPAWFSEAGTRVDQFRCARRQGATLYEASRAARMVSSDFANIGASRHWRMYVHTVPFLNAAIQGLDQLYQIGRRPFDSILSPRRRNDDRRAHIRKVGWAGGVLALASSALWVFNAGTDARRDAYSAETDYEKASWATLYDVAGDADFRIPVPFQIGAVFMKTPEIALDLAFRRETLAGPKFIWSLVHGNLAVGLVPAVLQPILEIVRNRNFFGNEIIPAYMADREPRDQFFDRSTPLPYRSVGNWLNVSPLHLQTLVRGWTGHLGNLAVTAADEIMWDERANGPKPFLRGWRMATGIYSLFPPRPRSYTRFGNEFYEISDWAAARARRASCRGSGPRVPAACEARTLALQTARAASELRRESDRVRTDANRSRSDKEAAIQKIYTRIDRSFRQALPELRALREQDLALVDRRATTTAPAGNPSPAASSPQSAPAPAACIDVNRASATELQTLRGVGPVIAGRIIEERGRGLFRSAADLQRVRGIGPRTVERLRDRVCGW